MFTVITWIATDKYSLLAVLESMCVSDKGKKDGR